MKHSAAVALAIAALLAAGETNACTLLPLSFTFLTAPAAFEAEVTKVRRVQPREWEESMGPVYVADFRLAGPARLRTLPSYRWATKDDCGPIFPVKEGQRVLLLLEADPVEAQRLFTEIITSSHGEDPPAPAPIDGSAYRAPMEVYPYTNDLSRIQSLLERYQRE
ncbi:hypothetical protein [Brevundimonas faecalis]|uniref:Uncharacterized protein n=1 Tax=Brevundimonas faecalis TaxID=947378 RepID=A0ABV2RB94_9CAUL